MTRQSRIKRSGSLLLTGLRRYARNESEYARTLCVRATMRIRTATIVASDTEAVWIAAVALHAPSQ